MADAAAQRREARRRRILENSDNRLKKITGLYSNGISDPTDDLKDEFATSDESSTRPSEASDRSAVKEPDVINNIESYMECPTAPENVPITDDGLWKHTSSENDIPLISPTSSLTSLKKSSVLPALCSKARLHIIALAVIVRILLTLPSAFIIGESAVIPLFTVEFIEWINRKLQTTDAQETPSGLLGMVLMLSGIAPQKVSRFLGILDVFNRITQDFFIYFFVFSLTHAFLQVLS